MLLDINISTMDYVMLIGSFKLVSTCRGKRLTTLTVLKKIICVYNKFENSLNHQLNKIAASFAPAEIKIKPESIIQKQIKKPESWQPLFSGLSGLPELNTNDCFTGSPPKKYTTKSYGQIHYHSFLWGIETLKKNSFGIIISNPNKTTPLINDQPSLHLYQ